jgi:hypothetical protein
MASGEASSTADSKEDSAKSTPRDARAMKAILKEMGVEDYEPRVINQMLEFTYRKSKIMSNRLIYKLICDSLIS